MITEVVEEPTELDEIVARAKMMAKVLIVPGEIYKMELEGQRTGESIAYSPRAGRMCALINEAQRLAAYGVGVYLIGREIVEYLL